MQIQPAQPLDRPRVVECGRNGGDSDRSHVLGIGRSELDAGGQCGSDGIFERDGGGSESRPRALLGSAVDGGDDMRGDGVGVRHNSLGEVQRRWDADAACGFDGGVCRWELV